jgi:hypothetical protein
MGSDFAAERLIQGGDHGQGILGRLLSSSPAEGESLPEDSPPRRMRAASISAAKRYIITIADDNRGPLDKICRKLIAADATCDKLRNPVRTD